jgi:hypothetical protein
MIREFAADLKAKIESEIERETGVTGRGAAKDMAEYRYRVGVYMGLKRAIDYLEDLKRQYNETEE